MGEPLEVPHVVNLDAVIEGLVRAVETRDPYTAGHQYRVAALCREIARHLGLDEIQVRLLNCGALIHDVGKIYVPLDVLNRPGRLPEPEMQMIRRHSEVGARIIEPMQFPEPIDELILHHHERFDGSGYPKGLTGDQVGIETRVLQLADVVESMSSHRPYRPALGVEQALAEIERGSGQLYDPDVVKSCVHVMRKTGFQFPKPLDGRTPMPI